MIFHRLYLFKLLERKNKIYFQFFLNCMYLYKGDIRIFCY